MSDARELLDAVTHRIAPLEHTAGLAWWRASTEASDAGEAARVEADLAVRAAYGDPELFAQVEAALATADPFQTRQLTVLRNSMLNQQIPADLRDEITRLEASIDGTFNGFRPTLDGSTVDDNAIADILRTSTDTATRERAWKAAKAIGPEVAASVRDLAHLRNRAARSVGARDFFELTLTTSELDETALFQTLDDVDTVTRAPFAAWKADEDARRARRFGVAADDLAPWHYDDPFFQSAPDDDELDLTSWFAGLDQVDVTRRTFVALGLDLDAVIERSDLLPRDRKSQHAFCIHIDRAGDVRVLCNNVPGEYWTETMLHEFGHAAYDANLDPTLPWLLRTMHPLTTEGVAMLFGRLSLDPEWLVTVAGVDADAVEAAAPALARRRLVALLVFARWVLVMTNFERGLYADPDADHDRRWWDLVEQYQLLHRPAGRQGPDWAAKIHVALAPVYYQNYLLGELVASQLQATLRERFGGIVGRRAVGEFLTREFFAPGWDPTWNELVGRATGRPLTVESFAAEVRGLGAH